MDNDMESLSISHDAYQQLSEYARLTGKDRTDVLNQIVLDWMFTNGEPVMEAIYRRREKAVKKGRQKTGQMLTFRLPGSEKSKRKSG